MGNPPLSRQEDDSERAAVKEVRTNEKLSIYGKCNSLNNPKYNLSDFISKLFSFANIENCHLFRYAVNGIFKCEIIIKIKMFTSINQIFISL